MMKKPILGVSFLMILTISLLIVRSAVSNRISVDGIFLSKINDQIATLKVENSFLREKLYSESSLNFIASKAAVLGFVEEKSSFVLTNPIPIAQR